MAIGISLYLLMYMWFEAINSGGYDSGGYGRSYGEIFRNKVRLVHITWMITIRGDYKMAIIIFRNNIR